MNRLEVAEAIDWLKSVLDLGPRIPLDRFGPGEWKEWQTDLEEQRTLLLWLESLRNKGETKGGRSLGAVE